MVLYVLICGGYSTFYNRHPEITRPDVDKLSFVFPTHTPVMVLQDPPGRTSSSSYENVTNTED